MINNKAAFYFRLLLLVVISFPACSRCSSTQEVPQVPVQCKLEIKRDDGGVFAHLVFENVAGRLGSIPKRNLLCEGQITFSPFWVTRDGNDVHYMGEIVDYVGPPPREDRYVLEPGQTYETTIRISDYYDFSSPGQYQVYYLAYYHPWGKFDLLQSNSVKFVIPK